MSRGGVETHEGDEDAAKHPDLWLYKKQDIGPIEVWVIDGFKFRNKVYVNFCQGGNTMAYPWLRKPDHKGPLIILDNVMSAEFDPILFHEIHEFNKMEREGLSYADAHDSSDVIEIRIRDNPALFQELFDKEVRIAEGFRPSRFQAKKVRGKL